MMKMTFSVKMPSDAELERLMASGPTLQRYKIQDKAVRAGAKPVLAKAKELAPRSSKTGTARKRSKSQRDRADWNYPVWKTIKAVVRKYNTGAFAAVGPAWPLGNKVFFNSAHVKGSRNVVLWGKRTGRQYQQEINWIKKAGDETLPAQRQAMKASLKKSLDEMTP